MRKQELYDFIERKLNAKRAEQLSKKSDLETLIRQALEKDIRGLDGLSASFSALAEVLEKARTDHHEAFSWPLNNGIRHVHDLIGFKKALASSIFYDIAHKYLVKGRDSELKILESKYPEALKAIQEIKEEYHANNKGVEDAFKLQKELEVIIKTSRSAKEAHKTLVALGIDMKDFKESSANLPAVQKLSVDVCVINGNC